MNRSTIAAMLCALLGAGLPAQLPGPGLSWQGSQGGGARSFLPGCQNLPVAAVPGETVAIGIWGDPRAPFVLFAATSGSQCLPFPGIGNGLVLDAPIATVVFGTLTQTSPCLSCPPGTETIRFTIPASLPRGTSLALQAVGMGAGNLAFTTAITGTI